MDIQLRVTVGGGMFVEVRAEKLLTSRQWSKLRDYIFLAGVCADEPAPLPRREPIEHLESGYVDNVRPLFRRGGTP